MAKKKITMTEEQYTQVLVTLGATKKYMVSEAGKIFGRRPPKGMFDAINEAYYNMVEVGAKWKGIPPPLIE